MKKICLLAIGSFFSALAFSQNAVQTVPGQPKAGRSNTTQAAATTATPATTTIVASAGDVGKTKTKAIARTTRTAAVKRTPSMKVNATPKAEL